MEILPPLQLMFCSVDDSHYGMYLARHKEHVHELPNFVILNPLFFADEIFKTTNLLILLIIVV